MNMISRAFPGAPRHPLWCRALVLAAGLVLGACASPTPPERAPASRPSWSQAGIAAVLAQSDRSEADRAQDARRHAADWLAFVGVGPGMQVLDLAAGSGYSSELLARAVGPSGRVFGQSTPPVSSLFVAGPGVAPPQPPGPVAAFTAGPSPAAVPRPRSADWLRARRQYAGLSQLEPVERPFEEPVPPALAAGRLDIVTLMFNYHDLGHLGVDRARMNRAVFAGLRPGGVYVLADHAGRPGTGISESRTLHRIEEAFLRQEVEAAGFQWLARSDLYANPADPRDQRSPEPPQQPDGFLLKFIKPW
ncbi:hypothetical protein PSQ39_02435 [Curvibacter sp. HBC28]|uniref:Methyltransferase n=1 Tax=Curvibacter microcysteis TaxID=3026419 RepID=A0ABT5ME82_9BURK|nr:hypothetical protein [Curvibacter sp. HBC28]MDD0813480.1 hypothetical protein [Curvibacter sp. HBC28]